MNPTRPRWVVPALVAALIAVLVVATWALLRNPRTTPPPLAPSASSAPTLTVRGTVQIDSVSPRWELGAVCPSDRGHEDIRIGAQVTVTDPTGVVLAIGELAGGKVAEHPSFDGAKTCLFAFTVDGVPAGKGIYGVEVTHRGSVQVAEADVAKVALTLR